jgi:hypothetical protein
MKLSDVRPGMQCTSLSVIRGTAPSSFDVEVIDVVRGETLGGNARILFRASGAAIATTGIGPGFSGSPIYCPDAVGTERVIGAISEGIGEYGNDVALATPIEAILGVTPLPPPAARKATALLRSARPLASPLTVSGLSGPVRRAALTAARRADVPLLAAPSSPALSYPPYELTPGTSVAGALSSGDIALAAIGTVTYRDGDKLWAFGHLLEGAGRRSLPLLDAYVYTIVDNPIGAFDLSTYKLAAPGRPVGTLTNDGLNAIAGRVGPLPDMIPLTVSARDLASGRRRTVRVDIADERSLDLGSSLDMIGSFAASEAITSVLRSAPPRATVSMCLRATVAQRRKPLAFCKTYFDTISPLGDLSSAFGLLDGFKYGPLDIRGVSVRMRVRPRVREAFIVGGRSALRVRRGQRVRIKLKLRRSRAGIQRLSFPYRIPKSTRPGVQLLTLRGQSAGFESLEGLFGEIFLFEFFGGGGPGPPRSVKALAERIAALGKPDGVRASFSRKRSGPVVYSSERLLIKGKTRIPMIVKGRKAKSRRSGYRQSEPPSVEID